MPCQDYTSTDEYNDRERARVQKRLNHLSQMLCGLCTVVERRTNLETRHLIDKVPSLRSWWEEHKMADAIREAKEQAESVEKKRMKKLVRDAVNKLSDEELKALGVQVIPRVRLKK